MSRITIVRETNTVIVDSVGYVVDCSGLPADFHALQWDGVSGEIEYAAVRCSHCGVRSKKGNEFIKNLTPYQPYVDAWGVAKAAAEAEAARLATEQAAAQVAAQEKASADAAG